MWLKLGHSHFRVKENEGFRLKIAQVARKQPRRVAKTKMARRILWGLDATGRAFLPRKVVMDQPR